VVVWLIVGRTPEPARIALRLTAAFCEQTPGGLVELSARHLAPEVEVIVVGAAEERYPRMDLAARAGRFRARHPDCSLTLENWLMEPAANDAAWVVGTLMLSSSQPDDLHAERRSVRALFAPGGHSQRLLRLELGPAERSLPEARP
jgi:hypothetical protein